MAELLIAHGADVNAKDLESGATPLYYAASWGRIDVADLLLAKGADPTLKTRKGVTVLDGALQNNQTEAADLIRRQMAQSK